MGKDKIDKFWEYWETGMMVIVGAFLIFLIIASIPYFLELLYNLMLAIVLSALFFAVVLSIPTLVGLVAKEIYGKVREYLKKKEEGGGGNIH